VPESLDRIVLKALARSPAERFASALALRDALATVIASAEAAAAAAARTATPAGAARTAGAAPAAAPATPPRPTPKKPETPRPAARPPQPKPKTASASPLSRVPRAAWLGLAATVVVAVIAAIVMQGGNGTGTSTDPTAGAGTESQNPVSSAVPQARNDSPAPVVTQAPPETTRVAGGTPIRPPDSAGQRSQTTPPRGRETPPRQTAPPVVTTRTQRDSPTTATRTEQTPPPPTTPSTAAVDSVRAFFAQASRLEGNGDYAGAFRSLGDAAARIVQLRAAFPTASVLSTLDQEHRDRRAATVRACQAFRDVRVSLGLTPPDCPASDS